MATTSYALYVDWSGDGDFGDTGEVLTDKVLSVQCERGKDFPSQLTGRSIAGKLIAVLNNESGVYSPFLSTGDLYGNLLVGRKVQLIVAYNEEFTYTFPFTFMNTPIWTGYIESIQPEVVVGNAKVAILTAIGGIGIIASRTTTVSGQSSKRTDELISTVLTDTGWSADDLDLEEGRTTVTKFFASNKKAIDVVREIEDTEAGFVWEKPDGKIKFEDRYFRATNSRSNTSVLTFTDAGGATHPYESIVQEDPLPSVFNVFEATATSYTVGSLAVLWALGETGSNSPLLAAGETKNYYAIYPPEVEGILATAIAGQVSVEAWTTPASSTDYTANAASDGSGTNLTSSIGISATKTSNRMKIAVTNNHATTAAYLTKLQARGTTVVTSDGTVVIAEDSTSQTAYKKRHYQSRAKWFPSTVEAQSWADFSLSLYKDPMPRLTISFTAGKSNNTLFASLDLDISERVTVTANGDNTKLGINEDFIVENIRHSVSEGKMLHRTTFELSPASVTGGFWALGQGNLGTDTKLVY